MTHKCSENEVVRIYNKINKQRNRYSSLMLPWCVPVCQEWPLAAANSLHSIASG